MQMIVCVLFCFRLPPLTLHVSTFTVPFISIEFNDIMSDSNTETGIFLWLQILCQKDTYSCVVDLERILLGNNCEKEC